MIIQLLKQFLKPDWRNILLTLIFMGFSYFFKVNCLPPGRLGVCEKYGFPISYLSMGSGDFFYLPQYSILWWGLVVDLIFLYLISCSIIFKWDKFIKKKNKTE